jgi:hypothetical protein
LCAVNERCMKEYLPVECKPRCGSGADGVQLLRAYTTKCVTSDQTTKHEQCSGRTPSQVACRNALKRGGKSYLRTE